MEMIDDADLTMKRIKKKTGHLALFLVFVQSDEFI